MSGKKKNGNQDDKALKTIVLVTAILNLVEILMEIIKVLIE